MTTSELAERKKELTECYTAEELADMYLKSEQQRAAEHEEAEAKAAELRAKLDDAESKHDALLMKFERVRQAGESAIKNMDELSADLGKAQREEKALNAALDVIMKKYVQLAGGNKVEDDLR